MVPLVSAFNAGTIGTTQKDYTLGLENHINNAVDSSICPIQYLIHSALCHSVHDNLFVQQAMHITQRLSWSFVINDVFGSDKKTSQIDIQYQSMRISPSDRLLHH